jgi:hypothetical protein
MSRKYPFWPSWDGKATSPVIKNLYQRCNKRWGFTNLGMYVNRPMRGSKNLSVHATGWAIDLGYPKTRAGRAKAVEAWNWLLLHSEELLICEIHDYSYLNPKQDPKDRTAYGRGFRCSRGAGTDPKSVKVFTKSDNAGSFGGAWLHVEVSNEWADKGGAEAFEAAWRALPKPVKTP